MTLLFHASDLHFGRQDDAALDWFVSEARSRRPDAIIITGDLTMRARRHEFAAARDWLAALPAPVLVEVGNHDLPYFNPVARFLDPYGRFGLVDKFLERPLLLDEVEVVPLATTARAQWRLDWSKGAVSPRRLAEAVRQLRASSRPHRLVICHHPLVDAGTSGTARTRGGAPALEALAKAGATAILSGHVHDPFDSSHEVAGRTVRLIGAGTLSERLRDTDPGYNRILLSGRGLEVQPCSRKANAGSQAARAGKRRRIRPVSSAIG